MKKAFIAAAILLTSIVANAQDKQEPLINRELIFELVNICAIVLVIYLISSFILQLIRQNLDYRLKSKIVEKETAENIVGQLVQPDKTNPVNTLLQWTCTLIGIAVGFTIIALTGPFGLHSLAIMAFSVAAGMGTYYLFIRRSKNQ
jgi:Na+/H+-translocating membrane pyrophosphatase